MIDRLFVVLGAGASYDCAAQPFVSNAKLRPPLVRELFDERFQEILARYPFAQAAAADIVPLLGSDSTFQLEQHIRTQYREGTHELAQRKYLALPLYLQEVLYTCGAHFARSPDAYDRLITAVSEFPHVSFVTLNYDTLLDDRLFMLGADPSSMLWYVSGLSQWSLFKLHGSVNWGRRCTLPEHLSFRSPRPDLSRWLEDTITLCRSESFGELRERRLGTGIERYYPALSVPVGAADELVCPAEHVIALREQLHKAEPAHLLVIGYSGLDQEVLQLLRRDRTRIGSITVVDKGAAAEQALHAMLEGLRLRMGNLQFHGVHKQGFHAFSRNGLGDYVTLVKQQAQ